MLLGMPAPAASKSSNISPFREASVGWDVKFGAIFSAQSESGSGWPSKMRFEGWIVSRGSR